eukprot:TRINITY_DN1890_c0_g1_i1.p1 TRINITY_DN1890_c0_g1~~TRINITY_DN1890_c0_g1_i1.p1  ORF type:complete len:510 (-),score=166.20 TRINITY_DN1890_c0_g1_i1:318-1847(-)
MLSALCWVQGTAAKSVPAKYEPTEEELQKYSQPDEEQDADDDADEPQPMGTDDLEAEFDKKFRMDAYDDDDDALDAAVPDADVDSGSDDDDDEESRGGQGGLAAVFGGGVKGLMYYASNADDPYITLKDDDADAESDSDIDDYTIRPSDALLVAVHTEDELSHLDVYVYEQQEANLYVHHDLLLPAFPLCLSWLDFHPSLPAGTPGNLVAVGTFLPGIELWDLDVVDTPEPLLVLGGINEQVGQPSAPDGKKKKKKKGKRSNARPVYREGSHTDAVLGVSWNALNRSVLASGSADGTVKVWQLPGGECVHTFSHHSSKVQAVQWHPAEAPVLLTGSFERQRSVALLDVRYPQSPLAWSLSADIEALQWNPHAPHQFVASSEDGQVTCFDVRAPTKPPVWQIEAHTKAVSAVAINAVVPELMATCSADKSWKLWDLAQDQPKLIYSKKEQAALYAASFFHGSSPLLLAVGGQGPDGATENASEERLSVHDLSSLSAVAKRYARHEVRADV